MISFTDHYNAIIIDRIPSTRKIGTDLWHFNNSLLNKTDFCSNTKNALVILKTKKTNFLHQVTGGHTPKVK